MYFYSKKIIAALCAFICVGFAQELGPQNTKAESILDKAFVDSFTSQKLIESDLKNIFLLKFQLELYKMGYFEEENSSETALMLIEKQKKLLNSSVDLSPLQSSGELVKDLLSGLAKEGIDSVANGKAGTKTILNLSQRNFQEFYEQITAHSRGDSDLYDKQDITNKQGFWARDRMDSAQKRKVFLYPKHRNVVSNVNDIRFLVQSPAAKRFTRAIETAIIEPSQIPTDINYTNGRIEIPQRYNEYAQNLMLSEIEAAIQENGLDIEIIKNKIEHLSLEQKASSAFLREMNSKISALENWTQQQIQKEELEVKAREREQESKIFASNISYMISIARNLGSEKTAQSIESMFQIYSTFSNAINTFEIMAAKEQAGQEMSNASLMMVGNVYLSMINLALSLPKMMQGSPKSFEVETFEAFKKLFAFLEEFRKSVELRLDVIDEKLDVILNSLETNFEIVIQKLNKIESNSLRTLYALNLAEYNAAKAQQETEEHFLSTAISNMHSRLVNCQRLRLSDEENTNEKEILNCLLEIETLMLNEATNSVFSGTLESLSNDAALTTRLTLDPGYGLKKMKSVMGALVKRSFLKTDNLSSEVPNIIVLELMLKEYLHFLQLLPENSKIKNNLHFQRTLLSVQNLTKNAYNFSNSLKENDNSPVDLIVKEQQDILNETQKLIQSKLAQTTKENMGISPYRTLENALNSDGIDISRINLQTSLKMSEKPSNSWLSKESHQNDFISSIHMSNGINAPLTLENQKNSIGQMPYPIHFLDFNQLSDLKIFFARNYIAQPHFEVEGFDLRSTRSERWGPFTDVLLARIAVYITLDRDPTETQDSTSTLTPQQSFRYKLGTLTLKSKPFNQLNFSRKSRSVTHWAYYEQIVYLSNLFKEMVLESKMIKSPSAVFKTFGKVEFEPTKDTKTFKILNFLTKKHQESLKQDLDRFKKSVYSDLDILKLQEKYLANALLLREVHLLSYYGSELELNMSSYALKFPQELQLIEHINELLDNAGNYALNESQQTIKLRNVKSHFEGSKYLMSTFGAEAGETQFSRLNQLIDVHLNFFAQYMDLN